jgi:putative thioredoxin
VPIGSPIEAMTIGIAVVAFLAAIAAGDPERGLQLLLDGVRGSSGESRDALRKVMVGVFADLGQDHPLALRYRRELASALY